MSKKFIQTILLIILIGVFFSIPSKKQSLNKILEEIQRIKDPCGIPITYSLGTIDSKFSLSSKDILNYMQEAEAIWEKSSGKNLFQYKQDNTGNIKINFLFDTRQENTEKLNVIKKNFKQEEQSYQKQRDLYETLVQEYNQKNSDLKDLVEKYNIQLKKYNDEVSYWNAQGGASKEKIQLLETDRLILQKKQREIQKQETILRSLKSQLESYYSIIDTIYNSITTGQKEYNNIVGSSSKNFHAGEYTRNEDGTFIDVYQFETKEKLIRLLAHELGHALGIEHTESPESIMYYLNSDQVSMTTREDLDALEKICKVHKKI